MDTGPNMTSLKLASACLKLLERVVGLEPIFIGLEGQGTTLIPYPH